MNKAVYLLAIVGAVLSSNSSEATILTFTSPPFGAINQNYGDNVATLPNHGGFTYGNDGSPTPNVAMSYANTSWADAGGAGVTFPTSGQTAGTTWSYTFTADPGYSVVLGSIGYGHAQNGANPFPTINYSVTGGLPAVFNGTITPNTALANLQTLSLGGVTGQVLTLTFTVATARVGGNDGLGFDNLAFTQVPEPASFILLMLGAMYLVTAKRRRRAIRS